MSKPRNQKLTLGQKIMAALWIGLFAATAFTIAAGLLFPGRWIPEPWMLLVLSLIAILYSMGYLVILVLKTAAAFFRR